MLHGTDVTASSPAPMARKPGARLAWIGQGFLGVLALLALVILVSEPPATTRSSSCRS